MTGMPVYPFLLERLAGKETWAKCDMLATVSLERLDRVMVEKRPDGKQVYVADPVTPGDLEAICEG